jgi:heme-degrading monooxygenase HmoA
MYAREWKCRCPLQHECGFLEYLHDTGIRETSSKHGFMGVQVFTRELEGEKEITFITYWDTLESIKAFSGEDIHAARLYPEDSRFEITPDTHVRHYAVLEHQFINDSDALTT